MRSTPAIRLSSGSFAKRNFPIAVAEAPSATKTSEKPMTKARDAMKTWARDADGAPASPRMSSTDTPETKEMYPGISGRTQGETNDRKPAANAASSVTFWFMPVRRSPGGGRRASFLLDQRDHAGDGRCSRASFEFHRRQILEHDVPLPALGGI